jgi:hypothetical protein
MAIEFGLYGRWVEVIDLAPQTCEKLLGTYLTIDDALKAQQNFIASAGGNEEVRKTYPNGVFVQPLQANHRHQH